MSHDRSAAVVTELDRDIGIVGAVALGVDTMIAAGIFVLSGLAVSNVGAMAIVAFLIAAVLADAAAALEGLPVETTLVEGDVVESIVARTGDHDLTVIGATQEGLLQELVVGAVPVEVGERAEGLIIMTKRNLGITSKLRRWLHWE